MVLLSLVATDQGRGIRDTEYQNIMPEKLIIAKIKIQFNKS